MLFLGNALESIGPDSSPGQGHCVVLGQDTQEMDTGELSGQPDKKNPGRLPAMD